MLEKERSKGWIMSTDLEAEIASSALPNPDGCSVPSRIGTRDQRLPPLERGKAVRTSGFKAAERNGVNGWEGSKDQNS
ncbi:hypothetical protein PCANC_00579 [Puccinia coronata f. sp. avenae]|jgi:hypothetical protein|uniref:Uncharacterized protein n=1 Tax=Puccinia coronata f. sp. avenae TaxID=200324 RepID=A0A2N5T439_9BASI|nr:hypothetical protein PCANC_07427 [Puccinia coronata f. sp. avenae]PLW58327.1 hypothetical protein PCANC_00579 [Puccinia coronata f. sp. avenae]